MSNLNLEKLTEFLNNKIKSSNKIIIFGHKHPDPDCICSAIALKRFINFLNPDAEVVLFGKTSKKYKFIKGIDEITLDKERTIYDLIFFVDTPDFDDVEDKEYVKTVLSKNEKLYEGLDDVNVVVIDHHLDTKEGFKTVSNEIKFILDPSKSSNCEIILDLILRNEEDCLDIDVATILGAGIYSETCALMHSNFDTLKAMSELMRLANINFYDMVKDFLSIPFSYEKFYSDIVSKGWMEISEKGLIMFEIPYKLLTDSFPRLKNKNVYRNEGYLTYLFGKFKLIKLGRYPYKYPKGVLGVYPNKYNPYMPDKFLMYEPVEKLSKEQINKLLELGFKYYRENSTRFMRPLPIKEIEDGSFKALVETLEGI